MTRQTQINNERPKGENETDINCDKEGRKERIGTKQLVEITNERYRRIERLNVYDIPQSSGFSFKCVRILFFAYDVGDAAASSLRQTASHGSEFLGRGNARDFNEGGGMFVFKNWYGQSPVSFGLVFGLIKQVKYFFN